MRGAGQGACGEFDVSITVELPLRLLWLQLVSACLTVVQSSKVGDDPFREGGVIVRFLTAAGAGDGARDEDRLWLVSGIVSASGVPAVLRGPPCTREQRMFCSGALW